MLVPTTKLRLVMVMIDRHEEAVQLIQTLMSEQLIYFGVISPPVYSLLGWHGMVREAKEHTMWLLSSVDHLNDLERRIDELHPSDNPILLILPLSEVSSPVATIVTGSWKED